MDVRILLIAVDNAWVVLYLIIGNGFYKTSAHTLATVLTNLEEIDVKSFEELFLIEINCSSLTLHRHLKVLNKTAPWTLRACVCMSVHRTIGLFCFLDEWNYIRGPACMQDFYFFLFSIVLQYSEKVKPGLMFTRLVVHSVHYQRLPCLVKPNHHYLGL